MKVGHNIESLKMNSIVLAIGYTNMQIINSLSLIIAENRAEC